MEGERDRPVTVREMRRALAGLPDDLRLFTHGYEGGYQDARLPGDVVEVRLNVHSSWYFGPHQSARDAGEDEGTETVEGVLLSWATHDLQEAE